VRQTEPNLIGALKQTVLHSRWDHRALVEAARRANGRKIPAPTISNPYHILRVACVLSAPSLSLPVDDNPAHCSSSFSCVCRAPKSRALRPSKSQTRFHRHEKVGPVSAAYVCGHSLPFFRAQSPSAARTTAGRINPRPASWASAMKIVRHGRLLRRSQPSALRRWSEVSNPNHSIPVLHSIVCAQSHLDD
jgi:hypothetical protein